MMLGIFCLTACGENGGGSANRGANAEEFAAEKWRIRYEALTKCAAIARRGGNCEMSPDEFEELGLLRARLEEEKRKAEEELSLEERDYQRRREAAKAGKGAPYVYPPVAPGGYGPTECIEMGGVYYVSGCSKRRPTNRILMAVGISSLTQAGEMYIECRGETEFGISGGSKQAETAYIFSYDSTTEKLVKVQEGDRPIAIFVDYACRSDALQIYCERRLFGTYWTFQYVRKDGSFTESIGEYRDDVVDLPLSVLRGSCRQYNP